MFPASSTDQRIIAPALLPTVQWMEERSPGLHVLAAREFRYPVQQQKVSIRAEQYRKMNLLEKFLLRAYTEISPPPSRDELAGVLGLDPIFIRSTFNDLITLQSINNTKDSLYVTEEGKKSLLAETVSQGSVFDTWYFLQDMILGTAIFSRQPLEDVDEALEDLSLYVKKDLTAFPAFAFHPTELQAQFQELGLDLHNPDEGRFVTEMAPLPPELGWKRIAIFVLYDTLKEGTEQAMTLQARSERGAIPAIGEWLTAQVQEQNLSLTTLCGLADISIPPEEAVVPEETVPNEDNPGERLEEIHQQLIGQLRSKGEGRTPAKEAGTALQLRDVDIRPAFLKALQEAREQIIIYSPWINEQVVDDDFISLMESLVKKGIHILIGYGIGRDEKREERPMPPRLGQRLRAIQTPESTPGIIAAWLGNSHAKEIIIDRSTHFSGSHNWLSYRGDRFPRGETVYQVTIPTEVEKAYDHLAQRFIEHAKILWSKATDEECRLALCILAYLDHEQEAVEWLQRDTCYHLIPLWLTLAQQTISTGTGHAARILTPLQTVITLCCTTIEPRDPLLTEIVVALRSLLNSMTMKNQKLTTKFVSDHSPELEQLGLSEL